MRRDKQAAKKKKKRESTRTGQSLASSRSALLSLAHRSPFGPAFATPEWSDETLPPKLVTAVLTRQLPDGRYIPQVLLLDRTCLGVKNAFVMEVITQTELDGLLDRLREHHGGVEKLDVVTVQAMIFAAVDYAAKLGFRPHRDFDAALAGPAPDLLVATPLAALARPFYVPGPEDDAKRIGTMLSVAVGPDGFDMPR